MLFATGSDEINAEGVVELDKLADAIVELAHGDPDDIPWVLQVNGHTDKRPITGTGGRFRSNWELSAGARHLGRPLPRRPRASRPTIWSPPAIGEFQPIEEGDSEEALAKNRRIELKLTER